MRRSVDVSWLKPMTNIFGDCLEGTRKPHAKAREDRS